MSTTKSKTKLYILYGFIFATFIIIIIFHKIIGPPWRYNQARKEAARLGIANVGTALERYKYHMGRYPKQLQGLTENPTNSSSWDGPYIVKSPIDPWGKTLHYRITSENGSGYDLWSSGPDKKSGTEDDIVSWETKNTRETF